MLRHKDFWLQLNDKLEKSGQMGVTLHIKNILFVEETSSKLQDKIVILAKLYIYLNVSMQIECHVVTYFWNG